MIFFGAFRYFIFEASYRLGFRTGASCHCWTSDGEVGAARRDLGISCKGGAPDGELLRVQRQDHTSTKLLLDPMGFRVDELGGSIHLVMGVLSKHSGAPPN